MDLEVILEREGVTSFSFADTEEGAIDAAFARLPDLITSDVKLIQGTGPAAVASIIERHGPIPVIFITATPNDCVPCAPPGIVLSKPLSRPEIRQAYHDLGPQLPLIRGSAC